MTHRYSSVTSSYAAQHQLLTAAAATHHPVRSTAAHLYRSPTSQLSATVGSVSAEHSEWRVVCATRWTRVSLAQTLQRVGTPQQRPRWQLSVIDGRSSQLTSCPICYRSAGANLRHTGQARHHTAQQGLSQARLDTKRISGDFTRHHGQRPTDNRVRLFDLVPSSIG